MLFFQNTAFYLLRFIVQFFCYILEWMVIIAEWPSAFLMRLYRKSEYIRTGSCQMTGQCCRLIGMEFPRSWQQKDWLLDLIKRWHHLRYNFSYLGTTDNLLVYECRYLTPENKCGIQRFKPALCRSFPKTPPFGVTKLHKGCGFSFVRRNQTEFEKMLTKARVKGR